LAASVTNCAALITNIARRSVSLAEPVSALVFVCDPLVDPTITALFFRYDPDVTEADTNREASRRPLSS
jgi:hypothetical protein